MGKVVSKELLLYGVGFVLGCTVLQLQWVNQPFFCSLLYSTCPEQYWVQRDSRACGPCESTDGPHSVLGTITPKVWIGPLRLQTFVFHCQVMLSGLESDSCVCGSAWGLSVED